MLFLKLDRHVVFDCASMQAYKYKSAIEMWMDNFPEGSISMSSVTTKLRAAIRIEAARMPGGDRFTIDSLMRNIETNHASLIDAAAAELKRIGLRKIAADATSKMNDAAVARQLELFQVNVKVPRFITVRRNFDGKTKLSKIPFEEASLNEIIAGLQPKKSKQEKTAEENDGAKGSS